MNVTELLIEFTHHLHEHGAIDLAAPKETAAAMIVGEFLNGHRINRDGEVPMRKSLREQVAQNIRDDVPPAFRPIGEDVPTRDEVKAWSSGPGKIVSIEGTVMDQAAQELLKIVRGEVTAKRYAEDDDPVAPDFDQRIRAAECLLGNRSEVDIKGLEGLRVPGLNTAMGSTGPR